MIKRLYNLKKAFGLVLCLVMIIGAIYVPITFTAKAEEPTTTTFTFDTWVSSTTNGNTANSNTLGYYGVGWEQKSSGSNKYLQMNGIGVNNAYNRKSGYRLENNGQAYALEPSTTYLMNLKVQATQKPETSSQNAAGKPCVIKFGYGAYYNNQLAGNVGNYINTMTNTLGSIVTGTTGSNEAVLKDVSGDKIVEYSPTAWHDVTIVFTTPADMGTTNTTLAFWGESFSNFQIAFDDIKITKYPANTAIVILKDEYSATTEILTGSVGAAVTLPDISDRAKDATHEFVGWYLDEERTQAAADLTFTEEGAVLYSKWKSPITYTFRDTFNNKDYPVVGNAGDTFTVPADPVDANGVQWFMGWYTTEGYSEEFTETTFGFADKTIYSLWISEKPATTTTFENYTYPKNAEIFGRFMRIENSAGLGQSDNYALRLDYKGDYVYKYECSKCKNKQNTEALMENHMASNHPGETLAVNKILLNTRASNKDQSFTVAQKVENNTSYDITVTYKVVESTGNITFNVATSHPNNSWDVPHYREYTNKAVTVNKSDMTGEWQTVTIKNLITNINGVGDSIILYITMSDASTAGVANVLIDTVVVKDSVQPSEAVVNLIMNGAADEILKGKRGEKVTLPTPVHPSGAEFKGWYLNKELTKPAGDLTFTRQPQTVYAKWGAVPITFKNYPYSTTNINIFGRLMKLENQPGIGIDDDYAMHLDFKGTYVYKYVCSKCNSKQNTQADIDSHIASQHAGETIPVTKEYFSTRVGNVRDHSFTIGQNLMNKTLYVVTFNYKIDSNVPVTMMPVTRNPDNIYYAPDVKEYPSSEVALNVDSKEWQTASFSIATDFAGVGNALSMFAKIGGTVGSSATSVDILFDNVIVEAFPGDVILLDTGSSTQVISGTAGDALTLPTPTGKTEFLGWYTDAACTVAFNGTTFPEGLTTLYAKWKPGPMDFSKYDFPMNAEIFGRLLSIDTSGIGIDNDNALRWNYAGDKVYKYVCECGSKFNTQELVDAHQIATHGKTGKVDKVLFNTRATSRDHSFAIAKNVANNTLYRISFKYKFLDGSNASAVITPVTTNPSNIWDAPALTVYSASAKELSKRSEWTAESMFVTTNFKADYGNTLALYLAANGSSVDTKIDLLIDDVLVERVEAPFAYFDHGNNKDITLIHGVVGEKINVPTPTRNGYIFAGWYEDPEFKTPLKTTHFAADTELMAYAKYNRSSTITFDFEDYQIPYYMDIGKAKLNLVLFRNVQASKAHSGKYVMEYDGTTELTHAANMVLAEGQDIYHLEKENQYIVEFNYRISQESTTATSFWVATAHQDNYYDGNVKVSSNFVVYKGKPTSTWSKATLLVDTASTVSGKEAIMLCAQNGDGKIQIDDVKITAIAKGQTGAVITTNGSNQIPGVIYGKKGQSFVNKLPKAPTVAGKIFGGYFLEDANGGLTPLKEEEMVFGDKFMRVYAMFLDEKVVQNFEEDYITTAARWDAYTIHDFDYEIYDSNKQGNSKDNVTSGRYSLHRKGESRYFESSVIFTPGVTVSSQHKYVVSMKVKLGKHFHTDGAIKIHSNKSATYAWSKTGDVYPVVAIKDLKEGEWVDVSFTLTSCEPYATIQTPGYVELWIDDITYTLVTDPYAVDSVPVEYVEYVPNKRDASGNVIDAVNTMADIESIIDARLKIEKDFPWMLVIIIAAAAVVLLAGGAVVLIVVLSKKKKAKAKA